MHKIRGNWVAESISSPVDGILSLIQYFHQKKTEIEKKYFFAPFLL
jgi:hypothetical protein